MNHGLIQNETSFAAVGSTAQLCCSVASLAVAVAFLVFASQAWSARNTARLWIWVTGAFVLLCFGLPAGLNSADDGTVAVSAYPTWFLPVYKGQRASPMCAWLPTASILLTTRAASGSSGRPASREGGGVGDGIEAASRTGST